MNKKYGFAMCIGLLLMSVCVSGVTTVSAQDYPKGPIQLVVPFSPGGATDIFWRTLGEHFSKAIGAPIAIVNKPGGGGIVGMSGVVNAKPDGYTLCAGNSDTLDITPLFTKDLPFNTIDDVNYIVKVANFPQSLVVRTESPYKTLDEVIAYARANPKKLKASTPGLGTNPYHGPTAAQLRGQGGYHAGELHGRRGKRHGDPRRPCGSRRGRRAAGQGAGHCRARSASWRSSRSSAIRSIRMFPRPMRRGTSRPSSTRAWASSDQRGCPPR